MDNLLTLIESAGYQGRWIRPETLLMVACARTDMTEGLEEHVRGLLRRDIDWTRLGEAAAFNGVTPLVCWNLLNRFSESLPATVLFQIQERLSLYVRRNLGLTKELLEILSLFREKGIDAIPYKGPALAALAYGNLSLRTFYDLDILVRRRDVFEAKTLLTSQGYRPFGHLSERQEAARLRSGQGKDFKLMRGDGEVVVELHWNVATSSLLRIDPGIFWNSAETTLLAGRQATTFSLEDWLVVLTIHGSKHGWERLQWVCDVAQLAQRNPRIDWTRVDWRAGQIGSRRMLHLGLLFAGSLYDLRLPDDAFTGSHATPAIVSLAQEMAESFLVNPVRPGPNSRGLRYQARLKDRPAERLQSTVHHGVRRFKNAFTPSARDKAIINLPVFLFFLYYFVRPVRLLVECAFKRAKQT